MTFAAVFETFTPGLSSSYNNIWNRWNAATAGWWIRCISTATNTTPVLVESGIHNGVGGFITTTLTAYPLRCSVIVVARYGGGFLTQWINGVAGANVAGVGFTAASVATMVGTQGNSAAGNARNSRISECVMLDTYDAQASYSNPLYGTGVAGLTNQWAEQLQQGQYLTPPSGVWGANDAYFSSRDVVQGIGTKTTWTDRSSNLYAATKTGAVAGASIIPRLQAA